MVTTNKASRSQAARRQVLASGIFVLGMALAAPSFARDPALSPGDFELRLCPPALCGEKRGLPTIVPAASSGYAERYVAPSTAVRVAEERRGSGVRGQLAQSAPAQPPGCTAQAEADDRPMVAFKVAFEFGSARLKPESFETLRNLGKALNGGRLADQKRFEIQGHTDAVGAFAYNEQLSKARADAVRDFLVNDMGVATERLAVVGKGYCKLANPANPYAGENRRVVVLNQSS
jgi:outer membrane protein OmpA-like peptidoglycan-associated protein